MAKAIRSPDNKVADTELREPSKYKMISPLLACGGFENKKFGEYASFESKIESTISAEESAGHASFISVYFRDFRGNWVGINENEKYDPGSLLKVPILIAYFKLAETEPSLLSKELSYDGSFDLNKGETFRSPYDIVPGVYKVSDLLKAMIVNSDNNATAVLFNDINHNSLSEVFTDLGLSIPADDSPAADFISAKTYAEFFRVLYNATYLSPDLSEKALTLLAGPDFPQGLRSTVPPAVPVAQKYGERTIFSSDGSVVRRELHDCGIVYAPGNPYFLCVMTRGTDFGNLIKSIQSVGRTVWSAVAEDKSPS